MSSPAGPYKAAQEAALRGSPALAAAMALASRVRIYTEVPENAELPYVVVGQDEIAIQNADCAAEAEVTSTVTWWSKTTPRDKGAQARLMGGAIVEALNQELTIVGWDVDEWEVIYERYLTDPDQSTKGIAVFRHLLTEQVA